MPVLYPRFFSFRACALHLHSQGGSRMNFLTDKIRPIYFKYLAAAFGSA